MGSVPFVCGLLPLSSLPAPADFLEDEALDLDEVDRVGTGLSLALELWEFDRPFSPLADDDVSLLDRRLRRSLGISEGLDEPWGLSVPSGD